MELFDNISGNVNCPYCGETNFISVQTKSLYPYQREYHIGSLLRGGPFLNKEYPLYHSVVCNNCFKEFDNSFIILNQEITKIISYTKENFDKTDFRIELGKSKFIEFIKKNCLTVILVNSNPPKIDDKANEQYLYFYAFKQLTDYVHLFKHRFGEDFTKEEFINSIFIDLENTLNKKYLLELNIDLSQFQEDCVRDFNYNNILNSYEFDDLLSSLDEDDLIQYLKKIIIENISDVKKRVEKIYSF